MFRVLKILIMAFAFATPVFAQVGGTQTVTDTMSLPDDFHAYKTDAGQRFILRNLQADTLRINKTDIYQNGWVDIDYRVGLYPLVWGGPNYGGVGILGAQGHPDAGSISLLKNGSGGIYLDAYTGVIKADSLYIGSGDLIVAPTQNTVTIANTLIVDGTVDATSGTTGSIHTDGGLGVAKKLYVGDQVSINAGSVTNDVIIGVNGGNSSYSSISLNADLTTTGKVGLTGGNNDLNLYYDVATNGDHIFRMAESTTLVTFDGSSGNVGIGTSSPNIILSGGAQAGKWLTVDAGSATGHIAVEGDTGAIFDAIDSGGASDDKWVQWVTDGGVSKFRSITDAGALNSDNILVMDIGTGNVGFGVTPSTGARMAVLSNGNDTFLFQGIKSGSSTTIAGIYQDSDGDGLFVGYTSAGAQNLFLTSNGDSYFSGGGLSIGEASVESGSKLDVDFDFNGHVYFGQKASTNAGLKISTTHPNNAVYLDATPWNTRTTYTSTMYLQNGGGNAVFGGKIGVNESNPQTGMHYSASGGNQIIRLQDTAQTNRWVDLVYETSGGGEAQFAIKTSSGGGSVMDFFLDASGNIEIGGGSSPNGKVHIVGAGGSASGAAYASNATLILEDGGSNQILQFSAPSGATASAITNYGDADSDVGYEEYSHLNDSYKVVIDAEGSRWVMDRTVSVASGDSLNLSNAFSPSLHGALTVIGDDGNTAAEFFLRGGVSAVTEVWDAQGTASTTPATASSVNVYYNPTVGAYYLRNERGTAMRFSLHLRGF